MFPANNLEKYFQDLEEKNWTLIPVDLSFSQKLLKAAKDKIQSQSFRAAAITESLSPQTHIRNDRILWLDAKSEDMTSIELDALRDLQNLRVELKDYFRISLSELECHFSIYSPGQFYHRHRDITAQNNKRFFSFVIYLNDDWVPADAGELIAYSNDRVLFTVSPRMGSMILFRSDLEHEVLPTNNDRYSLTGWIRQ